jgi:hypothetical protein
MKMMACGGNSITNILQCYSTEEVHCQIVGWPAPKTFQNGIWYFVGKIAQLKDEIILIDKHFNDFDGSITNWLMSIDGTGWPFDL